MIFVGSQKATRNGVEHTVEVYQASRLGTKSPMTFYYKFNGRFITPFEIKIRKWSGLTFTILLKATYSNVDMEAIFMQRNYLLENIQKTQKWVGGFLPIPVELK